MRWNRGPGRHGLRRFVLIAVLLAPFAIAAWAVWPKAAPEPDWAAAYDLTAHQPETIPPGAIVENGPPEGWSHLIIKSLPRVRPSERNKVNDLTARMASWMFTAFLADVKSDEHGRHRLKRIALGLGANVN